MKSMIRYKVKSDRAQENQHFVENVFEELRRSSPPGLHYATFKLKDGVSFVHIVSRDTSDNSLTQLPAFQAFQAGIQDRCEEQPLAVELEEVGSYQFFSD
ncbi:MAG: hypothetical protein ABI690_33230 [Chloroflexota bacterium]